MRAVNVQLPQGRRVLDFGCGTGWLLAEAQQNGPCLRIAVDYSPEAVALGKEQYSSISFAVADGLQLPFAAQTFEVVIGHVSMPYMNTSKALQELYRVMSPGGSLFLTFHSYAYVRSRLWMSFRRGNWKDVVFSAYMATNGLLNHLSFPQMEAWWSRMKFETVNTPGGVARTARRQGFTLVSTEYERSRIFFVVTARKPNSDMSGVLPAPGWSAYCPLVKELAKMKESTFIRVHRRPISS